MLAFVNPGVVAHLPSAPIGKVRTGRYPATGKSMEKAMGWRESGRLPGRVFLATASCSHTVLFFWQGSETVFRAPLSMVNVMRSVAASIRREIPGNVGCCH